MAQRLLTLLVGSLVVVLSVAGAVKDFDADSGYLYVDEDTPGTTLEEWNGPPDAKVQARWKRDTTDSGWSLKGFPGAGYLRKLNKMMKEADNLPPPIKDAIRHGDFSNVTADQVRSVNVSVLEYIPPNMFAKMNNSVVETIIKLFVDFNRPNALGRLVTVVGDKLNPLTLLDKIPRPSEAGQPNEAASVLLYSALHRLGDKDGISESNVKRLANEGLLKHVPEEQLMKVKDGNAAKAVLERLYNSANTAETLEEDDKALVFKLVETQHGPAKNWTDKVVREVAGFKYTKFLPAAFIKLLKKDTISSSITSLRDSEWESPLQAKTVAESYLENAGIRTTAEGGGAPPASSNSNLLQIVQQLGKLAAFVNPATTNNQNVLGTIVQQCDKMNLPAPLKAITSILQSKLQGNKVSTLTYGDLRNLKPEVLKQSPPEVVSKAMETQALTEAELEEMGRVGPKADQGFFGSPFFKGLISQLTTYAVKFFRDRNAIDRLPGAYMGGLGAKDIQSMDAHELIPAFEKLKKYPDALDETQKALLLKRLLELRLLDAESIPPEFSTLKPRGKKTKIFAPDIDGLLSDSELRLAYGEADGKPITASLLDRDPKLVGTLTPKQVKAIKLEDVPGVLAAVRRSKDGPQPQTLQALRDQFVEYLRVKSDDYEGNDKKLLTYVSAAEVSKLPASVLAYFIDPRQTSKLPVGVRKEILIALGEMSAKDRALIPGKTRQEIITQGLDALDSLLGAEDKYDVAELAAIGGSVGDLSPKNIERLSPVALEQSLDRLQGTGDEEGGLKQRACLSQEQKTAWRNQLINNYGQPKSWDPATVTALCCILPLLHEDDLQAIAKESLVTCRCASDNAPPQHLTELKKSLDRACEHDLGKPDTSKKVFDKVKTERAFDLSDLESQILTGTRRRKRAHDHSQHGKKGQETLSCYAVRLAGNGAAFAETTLETLDPKSMRNCLYELGSVRLEPAQAKVLWTKLAHTPSGNGEHHGAELLQPADLRAAGYILSGITLHEVDSLNFSNPDIVAAFGRPLGFSKTLLEKIAKHLQKHKNNKDQFSSVDLILANNILCGFEIPTLSRIVPETFAEALPVLRNLDPSCELTRLNTLVNIATHQQVYGPLETWTSADVRGVGILLTGLTTEIKKIPAESLLGLSPGVAAALNENTLKSLTAEQLGFVPRFSAQALTEPQLSALTSEGREALQSTIRGPLVTDASNHLAITIPLLLTTALLLL